VQRKNNKIEEQDTVMDYKLRTVNKLQNKLTKFENNACFFASAK